MKIWKYELEITPEQRIEMPFRAEMLTVQNQGDRICLWALVDPTLHKVLRDISIIGSGLETGISFPGNYLGTVQIGRLVWHVFERVTKC